MVLHTHEPNKNESIRFVFGYLSITITYLMLSRIVFVFRLLQFPPQSLCIQINCDDLYIQDSIITKPFQKFPA